ncbi:MAG TPA: AI-2E family transporter [Longimicrobiaceae bacterium]|nr:AI-2E family transporter [Longimicrobiaceae bacterium]
MPDSIVRRITWRSADIAAILTLVALFLLGWTFFWRVYTALFLGLIAILLAMVLHAPARYLSRWIPFKVAFAISILGFLAALAGIVISVIPQIAEQVSQLAAQLPSALQSVSTWIEETAGSGTDSELLDGINQQLADFIGRFVPLAFNLISLLFGSFAVVILAIFLAAQPNMYRSLLLRLLPPHQRERWARVYDEAGISLRNWVIGKALTMALVGIFTWIGLTLFEIPGALALAALAAILEFIPNFGPTIAAAPAVIAAFAISPATALYVAIFYFVLQQIQSAVTVPLVERRAVDIPPAVLLIWQLMLAVGFGILGLFIATPLLAVIVVVLRVLYLEPTEERYSWDRREAEAVHGEIPAE